MLQDISATHRDSIFYQASLPKKVWDLAVDVMDRFEKAKLKDQKLRSAMATAKPDFKQQYLAPIRCLNYEDQCFLLERCKNGHISLKEMKNEASSLKKMYSLKNGFVKLTNSRNWEDAVIKFPRYACEAELRKFITFDIVKEFPQPFINFCKRAKCYEQSSSGNGEQEEVACAVKNGDAAAFVICTQVDELNGQIIASKFSKFNGADLILLSINEVCCFIVLLYWSVGSEIVQVGQLSSI